MDDREIASGTIRFNADGGVSLAGKTPKETVLLNTLYKRKLDIAKVRAENTFKETVLHRVLEL